MPLFRTICGKHRTEHVTPFFKQLKILKLRDLYKLEVGNFMFQLNSNKLSKILENSFQILDERQIITQD